MDRKKQHLEQLATRYLSGKLEDGEYGQLLDMLQDRENASWFYSLKDNWQPGKDAQSLKNWERIAQRINVNSIKTKKQYFVGQPWMLRVAAVLIVGLLITSGILYLENQNFIQGVTVIETPRGEKSKVYLPDGTEVWLNASSRLSYNSFSKKERKVSLAGEAFFKVKRNESAPFTVKTSNCEVEVLGTEFNVMAYGQLKRNEITLFKGKVNVKTDKESAVLDVGDRLLIVNNSFTKEKANLDQTSGWVENKFNFNKVPLEELILRLENWYDVDIQYDSKQKEAIVFSGTFKNEETIWQVLDAINVYIPIQYEKTDTRKITLMIK
jgi:ferric-dicitrate binding protein FerR (iron transport regulator)